MFGRKSQAEATVVTREMIHDSAVEHGSNYNHWHYQTWRFVLDVHPDGGQPNRVGVEQKIRYPNFTVPDVGNTVRVEYDEKNPDKVELALEGDDRYDDGLRNREEKDQHKASQASRDAAFQATLDAPPGTPGDNQSQAVHLDDQQGS